MKDIVIGSRGEIGKAILKCYSKKSQVVGYDLGDSESIILGDDGNIRAMHICFGCMDQTKFIRDTMDYIIDIDPKIVIIHSTVPVGTSRKIYNKCHLINKKTIICHSPVMGKHPRLYYSIKKGFTKFYAVLPNSFLASNNIVEILKKDMKLKKIQYFKKIESTELAKLMSTTRYANHIAIVTEMKRYCKENKVNFNDVYTEWEMAYNAGYKKMNMDNFVRPILEPCKGKCGGHCIVPNLSLIRKYMKKTWLTDVKPKLMFYLN